MNIADFDSLPQLNCVYGPVRQLAYVVIDIDEAINYWQQNYSVGPFMVARDQVPLKNAYYRGQKSADVRVNIAFAYIGDVQLELIELISTTPSLYKEALEQGIAGVHHYGVCVDNFADTYHYALNNGFEAVLDSGVDGLARMSYLENRQQGLILEVIEWNSLTKPYFDEIERRCNAADPLQLIHEFKLSEIAPQVAILKQAGKYLVRKIAGRIVKTMPT